MLSAPADNFGDLGLREFDIMTQGQRSAKYASGQHARANGYLIPFFGSMVLPEITAGKVNEYRVHRLEECKALRGKPPARSTMHQEIVTLRQIFKTALRHGWVDHLPDFSAPYRASPKISHRAWFSPEEYRQLYEATRKRVQDPKQPRFRWEAEQLHDYVLFSANTGLRPDEARRLQFRDVTVIEDACRAIDNAGSLVTAWAGMRHAGVARVLAAHLGVGVARL